MKTTVTFNRITQICFFVFFLIACNSSDMRSPELKAIENKMEKIDDATLQGPDKNNNGVRDDVEYWINNAPEILNNDIKRATMWLAKTIRDTHINANNKQHSIEAMYEFTHAHRCLRLILRETNTSFKDNFILDQLIIYSRNTKKRHIAAMKADRNFAGQGGTTHKFAHEGCPFKLEKSYYKRGEKYDPGK